MLLKTVFADIRNKSGPSQEQTKLAITALDQNATTGIEKMFEGGCQYLLDWWKRNSFLPLVEG